MAAAKPEVVISQLPDKIETKFQRLNRYFWVQELSGTIALTVRHNRKSVFQDGGRQTGSTYISAISPNLGTTDRLLQRLPKLACFRHGLMFTQQVNKCIISKTIRKVNIHNTVIAHISYITPVDICATCSVAVQNMHLRTLLTMIPVSYT